MDSTTLTHTHTHTGRSTAGLEMAGREEEQQKQKQKLKTTPQQRMREVLQMKENSRSGDRMQASIGQPVRYGRHQHQFCNSPANDTVPCLTGTSMGCDGSPFKIAKVRDMPAANDEEHAEPHPARYSCTDVLKFVYRVLRTCRFNVAFSLFIMF